MYFWEIGYEAALAAGVDAEVHRMSSVRLIASPTPALPRYRDILEV
jgi:hypothetical protein